MTMVILLDCIILYIMLMDGKHFSVKVTRLLNLALIVFCRHCLYSIRSLIKYYDFLQDDNKSISRFLSLTEL